MPLIELVHSLKAPPAAVYARMVDPALLAGWEPTAIAATALRLPLTDGSLFLARRRFGDGEVDERDEVTELSQHGGHWRFAWRALVPDASYHRAVTYDLDASWSTFCRVKTSWDVDRIEGFPAADDQALRSAILDGLRRLEALAAA